jgi:hypothetical protein
MLDKFLARKDVIYIYTKQLFQKKVITYISLFKSLMDSDITPDLSSP